MYYIMMLALTRAYIRVNTNTLTTTSVSVTTYPVEVYCVEM